MKKKWLIPVIIITLILILIAAGFFYFANSSYGFSTGRCYVTQNGDYLIILGNDPIKMSDQSKNKDLFEGLNTGDEIQILHDGIQESYPGGTGVYYCKLVQKGSVADIPEKVIESLSPMGWIPVDDTGRTKEIYTGTVISYEGVQQDEGNFLLKLNTESGFTEEVTITVVQSTEVAAIDGIAAGDRVRVQCLTESSGYKEATSLIEYQEVTYEYGFANMSLVLPAGWTYEIVEYNEESLAFGINFWPENQSGGKIRLEYWPGMFGVCGTGLEQEEIRLENGLRAWQGTYDNRPLWDFISFRDLPGSYVFCTQSVDDWWEDYQEQAMEIINSVKLADGIIGENSAIELAAKALNVDGKPVRTEFDFCEGTWLIQFEENGITYTVPVDHEGNVGKISEYDPDAALAAKPVIYLYTEVETEVTVKLDFDGTLTTTYPEYQDGWTVTARPDGTLVDPQTGREYYCLFWEGISNADYDFSKGFVVPGQETREFLEDALSKMGLTDKEANEFIIYWLPQMEGNPYNLISFQQAAYTDSAELTIEPKPDSLLRVFMAWKALDTPIEIPAQELHGFDRTGFTVVEWGGIRIGV